MQTRIPLRFKPSQTLKKGKKKSVECSRASLEAKLIHLIHRVLFASQTASVIQSLWKSAPDFVKRLSLLFFGFKHTQRCCVIVKRTDVKYITFRS